MASNPKKKILYLIQLPPPIHGVSIINEIVYNSQVINNGFKKKLIELKFSTSFNELRKISFKKAFFFFKIWIGLFSQLLKYNPDLIYFSFMPIGSGFLRDSIFVMLMKIFHKNVILHIHNRGISRYKHRPIYKLLYQLIFKNLNIIHLSESLRQTEIDSLKIRNIKSFVIENTINPILIQPVNKIPPKINLLFISNLIPTKGLRILLTSILEVSKTHSNIYLDICGASWNSKEDDKNLEFVLTHNLSKIVRFHGPCYDEKKQMMYSNADIFIFPSHFEEECFPLVILEAMSSKLPIVSTKIGAIPEIIENGKNGLLVGPEDQKGLTEKIKYLIENSGERIRLGQEAFMKYEKHYTKSVFEKKMRSLFLEVSN